MTALEYSRSRGWVARLAKGWAILTPLNVWRKKHHRLLTVFVIFVSHQAGSLTSVRALLETRTSQGIIPWIVSLNTFPYLAVPAYWFFGRSKFEGYVSAPTRLWIASPYFVTDEQFISALQLAAQRGGMSASSAPPTLTTVPSASISRSRWECWTVISWYRWR